VFMNAEFIAMLDYLERERGIKREILLEAVSNALLSASKKSVGASRDLRIDINRKTGEIRALANLVVVDQVANPQDEIDLSKARKIKPGAYVVAVENGVRGPEIIVSRSHPNFVRRLFELEVSEIADGTVEIRGIAREAGYRTKIAVWSAHEKVDPVGACVGMRGSRVKNIV